MPIIGKNTDGTSSLQFFIRSQGLINPIYFYTAVAGDVVTLFHWRGSTNLAGNVTITCGVYTVTLGIPDVLIGSTGQILVTSATIQDWTSGPVSVNLTAGVLYCVAWSPDTDYLGRRLNEGVPGVSTDLAVPLPAIWNEFSQANVSWTFWADVVNTPPPTADIIFPCCAQLIN